MRGLLSILGVALFALGAAAGEPAGKEAKAGEAKGAEAPAKAVYVVVVQDKAPLMFQDSQIGELAEGLRLQFLQEREGWSRVRATFGSTWFEGWVRSAMVALDSLADVAIKIAPTRPTDFYRDPTGGTRPIDVPTGKQILEVKVKFEPTEKSPTRVFLRFGDETTADLYLTYGRGVKVLPYAFIRHVAGVTRPVFEREEKRQTLLLTPAEPQLETYVFTVPFGARDFELVLKDVVTRVPPKK